MDDGTLVAVLFKTVDIQENCKFGSFVSVGDLNAHHRGQAF